MQRLAAFAIDANNVLVARDDARLDGGDAARVGDNAFVGNIRGAQVFAKRFAGLVGGSFAGADDAKHFDARAERGEICGDVSGAAEAFALLDEIDDGDGGFGREARRGAPEIAVEHEVADDSDAFAAKARDKALEASGGLGEVSGRSGHNFGDVGSVLSAVARSVGSFGGLVDDQDRNVVADRVDAAAGVALKAASGVGELAERGLAFRTDENVEKIFGNRHGGSGVEN